MTTTQPTKTSRWTPSTLRTGPSKADRGFLGHPRGLPWMLNVEMWERFSYYGMRAILLFFITDNIANGGLGIDENTGAVILAVYGAAVYLLSIPGGIFADRVIGPWRSTFYGGIVIMAGHICLSIPIDSLAWAGIVLVAVGTGFIKPNLSTIVGGLYDQGDPRRDTGFQLFYMSINVGAFASPLVTGWLRETYSYHAGFAAAAIGMAFALVAFVYGRSKLSAFAFDIPNPLDAEDRNKLLLISLSSAAGIVFVAWALYLLLGTWPDAIAYTIFVIALGASIAYFVIMFRSPKVTSPERTHLRAYISLWIGAVLFWMIYEQASGKMAIFAQSHTNGKMPFFGWTIGPEAYQSVSPAAIVLLAPLVGWFFSRRTGQRIPTVIKFATAVLIISVSALMLGYGFQSWTGGTNLAPWWFLALVFVVQTVGELFLSPVGLSTTTALAPKSFASQAMVLWLLASATGQGLAAVVIANTEEISDATYYYGLGAVTIVVAVAIFAAAPWTQRQMADVDASGPAR